jgi:hypothetical protein
MVGDQGIRRSGNRLASRTEGKTDPEDPWPHGSLVAQTAGTVGHLPAHYGSGAYFRERPPALIPERHQGSEPALPTPTRSASQPEPVHAVVGPTGPTQQGRTKSSLLCNLVVFSCRATFSKS